VAPTETEEQFLQGTVRRVTYRSPETGFGVMRIDSDTNNIEVTLVGEIPATVASGSLVLARGSYQKHPKFGDQFKAFSITEVEPTTEEGLIRYLASGSIKGFGEILAERVVTKFGTDTIRVLDEEPHRLAEVTGIGKRKLDEILLSWQELRKDREVQLFFSEYGISGGLAHKISRAYGKKAIEKIKSNPYLLCQDLWGVGFQTADKIALKIGIDRGSDQRLGAGLEHALKTAAEDGHTCLPESVLIEKTAKQLQFADHKKIETALERIVSEARIIRDQLNGRVLFYSPLLHQAECALAAHLRKLIGSEVAKIDQALVEAATGEDYLASSLESRMITLSEEQRNALRLAARSPLTVITGGPGCGKTTLVRALVSMFRKAGLNIRLASPTGRAAQRLSEVCEHEASTIHRLLKFDPIEQGFVHCAGNPIEECDVLMIDETSMLDVPLAEALLQGLPNGARVIFIGDADQLPSVGPGLFLGELLEIARSSTIRLTNLFRRANESLISVAAYAVNAGDIPNIPEPDGVTKSDAYFLPIQEAVEGAALIEKLVSDQIPKKFGFQPSEITVLTPMNQGLLGTLALNQRLQERYRGKGLKGVSSGLIEFRLGDRVCQRVNNYQIHPSGVFNGDQGEVVGVDHDNKMIVVRLWDGREIEYTKESLNQLDLAYALSIHRSQGSEIPAVVLALHESHSILLERQLLYTAITRAKKLLVIVGSRRALAIATKRTRSRARFTGLLLRSLQAGSEKGPKC